MAVTQEIEALALLEIEGLPRAIRAQDAALKKAPMRVLACTPVSPGKAILLLGGDVASVEEALKDAEEIVGARRLDRLFLPGVHPDVVRAITGGRAETRRDALAILELTTVAAAIVAADAAVKSAHVTIGRLHLATGFGGRGFFTLLGEQGDVEAAVAAAGAVVGDKLCDHEIIPAPHDELYDAAFVRTWPLDPADGPVSGTSTRSRE